MLSKVLNSVSALAVSGALMGVILTTPSSAMEEDNLSTINKSGSAKSLRFLDDRQEEDKLDFLLNRYKKILAY
jgi:hypothetical protein